MLWALGIAIWRRPGAFVADERRCPLKVQVPAPGFARGPFLVPRYQAGGPGPHLRATLVFAWVLSVASRGSGADWVDNPLAV